MEYTNLLLKKHQSNKNENNNTKNTNQIEIVNEAIRKALKDKNWIIKNIVGTAWNSEDEEFWKRIYDDAEFTFAKLNNDKNTLKYIINLDSYSFILITYEDEKVITSYRADDQFKIICPQYIKKPDNSKYNSDSKYDLVIVLVIDKKLYQK